jgi:hypothetical protein
MLHFCFDVVCCCTLIDLQACGAGFYGNVTGQTTCTVSCLSFRSVIIIFIKLLPGLLLIVVLLFALRVCMLYFDRID